MKRLSPPVLLLALLAGTAHAERAIAPPPPTVDEGTPMEALPEEAPAEEGVQPAEAPQVTIIKREGATIEEYRTGGHLYMVKITPAKGYPYYLIDTDGDGSLETRRNDLDNPEVVQWPILRW